MNSCINRVLLVLAGLMVCAFSFAQTASPNVQYIEKRYNIFFRINSTYIDQEFQGNRRTIEQMRKDIQSTLEVDGTVPDSLIIFSTASPDGRYSYNKWLASMRAERTLGILLRMFPEFKDSNIKVEHLDEDWDGLMQVLLAHPEFPQREEMLAVIRDDSDVHSKEKRLRALTKGWQHLVDNYIYSLRNSSITLSVVRTEDNYQDEFVRSTVKEFVKIDTVDLAHKPKFEHPTDGRLEPIAPEPPKFRKTHFAARTNLLTPGLSIGLEFPIHEHWSIGINYNYPWAVSAKNLWCSELLSIFVDAKYWFTNNKTSWLPDSRLKGHGVGLYAGTGYYDYQNRIKGAQGEFIDFGVDYVYALPVANDKLRLEFNLGIGMIKTWYRPYNPSSDYTDLIKEPGVKYRSTDFVGPTRAGVSLVYPITTKVKKNPYTKVLKRQQRKADKKNRKAGGKND